ncbi:MAG: sulfur oxidation c-type cytochrome SoxX [Rubrivivax sp.]|nr:sulfur oxidation c-type cytochrome SoxX [Rubrivivax sp.]
MNIRTTVAVPLAAFLLAGCATPEPRPDYDALLAQMMRDSFRDEGIAKADRLQQDAANAACSKAAAGSALPEALARSLQEAALKSVRLPSDGKFLGDWREGEKLAQSGRGMTWTDKSAAPATNGGNCYNCHQITAAEISFGTIGPSLLHYGRQRGVTDPESPLSRPIVEYTWTKLYNARAFSACSGMPRFGHAGVLDETQLRNLMALLLDPKSPVNQ